MFIGWAPRSVHSTKCATPPARHRAASAP
jgi:hypothetical protein